ncbi:hypothetical protein Lal_00012219, partial [Lupinus albus]
NLLRVKSTGRSLRWTRSCTLTLILKKNWPYLLQQLIHPPPPPLVAISVLQKSDPAWAHSKQVVAENGRTVLLCLFCMKQIKRGWHHSI